MSLKPTTEVALNGWAGVSTWDSDHPADRERFYDFVNHYQKDHGFTVDENELRRIIEQVAHGPIGAKQRDLIAKKVSLAVDILEFLRRTGR